MCRAIGEGGRRCMHGETFARKHNDRRRKNRAIKNNVIAWAEQEGCMASELQRLRAAPPKVVKEWAEQQGVNPEAFADGIPSGVSPNPGGSVPPLATPAPAPAVQPPPAGAAAGAGRHRAAGGGAGGGGAARGGAGAPVPTPPARQRSWETPELREQIKAAQAQQGQHRDERNLLDGNPRKVKAVSGGTNETFEVEFDNGMVGYFKPFKGVKTRLARGFGHDGNEQPMHEVAAWRLASQLGEPYSDMVAPVVMRDVGGQMGSVALERPGKTHNRNPWNVPEWREAAFFDSLIGQQDRHPGNFLVAGDRIALIDHGYSFANEGDYCNWSWLQEKRATDSPQLTYQERSALEKVVRSSDVLGLDGLIGTRRAEAVRDRAQRMLDTGRVLDTGAY